MKPVTLHASSSSPQMGVQPLGSRGVTIHYSRCVGRSHAVNCLLNDHNTGSHKLNFNPL